MKTQFNFTPDDEVWERVKNHCRTTDNKGFTENYATDKFKENLLISEHSPIRLLEFDWTWKNTMYWVSTEYSRHKFEKFISTRRDDRLKDSISRDDKPQGALVNFDGYANMQNSIDAWRKRLCRQADPKAVTLAEDYKYVLHKTHPLEASMLQKNCIYRCGCPEFESCGYWEWFVEKHKEEDLLNIKTRYRIADEDFYERRVELIEK